MTKIHHETSEIRGIKTNLRLSEREKCRKVESPAISSLETTLSIICPLEFELLRVIRPLHLAPLLLLILDMRQDIDILASEAKNR